MPVARRGYRSRVSLRLTEGKLAFESEEDMRCRVVRGLERCESETRLNDQVVERKTRVSLGPVRLAESTASGDGSASVAHVEALSFSGRLPHQPGERWSFVVRGTEAVVSTDGGEPSARRFVDRCSGDGKPFHLPTTLASAGPATSYHCNDVAGQPLFRGVYLFGAGLFVDARTLDAQALHKGETLREPSVLVLTAP